MCRQIPVATYLTLNALHDNAQSFVFPFTTITVGHFLYREMVIFLYTLKGHNVDN